MENIKVPEFLFYVINSLTQAEKRYFKMNSNFQQGQDEKLYIRMFDAIDKMEQYNEKELLKYVDKKKLSVSKNFLYNKILRSLRAYNERSSIDIELYNLATEGRILMEKGLFYPALKRLKKAKKTAIDHEKSLLLVEIIDLEIDILGEVVKEDIEGQFKQLFDEALETLNKYSEAIQMKRLSRELHSELILARMRTLQEIYTNKIAALPKDSQVLRSFHAQSCYHSALAHYCRLQSDMQGQMKHLKERVELWGAHPNIIKTHYQQYRVYLSNYTISRIFNNEYEDIEDAIKEIEQLAAKSKYQKASRFQNVEYIKLLYYLRTSRLNRAYELVPKIEKNILLYRDLINKSREIALYYNVIIVLLGLQKYKEAKDWLNKIIYDKKSEPREAIKRFAWVLEIIIHDKLGSDEVVQYIFNDAKSPVNRPDPHNFEVLAFKHLKKITSALTGRKALYKEFKDELDEFARTNKHFGLSELSIWVESNITNMPFAEVLKKRLEAVD